jgi:hypothetical protein
VARGLTPNGDGSFTFTTPQPIELDTGETLPTNTLASSHLGQTFACLED